MKKLFISLSLIAFFFAPSITLTAQTQTTTRFFVAYDYGNVTIDNTAGGVPFPSTDLSWTSEPLNTAQLVSFTIDCSAGTTCPIRFTVDGTAPTTSVGMRADYQQTIQIYNRVNLVNFRAIREGATSAILNVTYWR